MLHHSFEVFGWNAVAKREITANNSSSSEASESYSKRSETVAVI